MNDVLVSVYMPTKNRAALMERAVESVLAQSHTQLELIVVDDGSTDATREVLARIAARDPRLRHWSNEASQGAPAARNAAIRSAKGEFVTGLDDDDCFLPGRLAALVAYWRLLEGAGERPSFVYTQEIGVRDNHRERSKRGGSVEYADMFQYNRVGNQVFAPREHYLAAGLFDERLPAWQDLEFFMRLLQTHGPARLLDHVSYEFDNSSRNDRISKRNADRLRTAFGIVAAKHAPQGGRPYQTLLLQIFSGYYRHTPGWRDWVHLLQHGWWLGGLWQLLRATLRGWLR